MDEFLRRVEANIGELDRVEPPLYTQIFDGLAITIVRVQEELQCTENELPFETVRQPTNGLNAGEEQMVQRGVAGLARVCERCIIENGALTGCLPASRTVLQEPREEVIFFGPRSIDVPITVEGQLAYISGGQAWMIEGNAINRRLLTFTGGLDGRVFDLSQDGRQLLFTRQTSATDDPNFANELWAILDTTPADPEAVQLGLNNVLYGGWKPGTAFTVSYSTAEPSTSLLNGWEAYNDAWTMRIDSRTGETLDFVDIVEPNSLPLYAYWGTRYAWSPDGEKLAWSRADSVGLVDLESGDFDTLISFPHFEPAIISGWVWQPEVIWSADSSLLITTRHGPPAGGESPTNSIVFDVSIMLQSVI
ncbi:MAG: hypothetical protein HC915_09460 [Anaerolineae bacterium]|nr:hypothetical protein [Anaerolineae bacterium]